MASPRFPEPPQAVAPTPSTEVEKKLATLVANKDKWVALGVGDRIRLLERCIAHTMRVKEAWVADACRAKGIPADSPQAGEEWLAGPVTTVKNMRELVESLRFGGARPPAALRSVGDDQVAARVFPTTTLDKLMMGGVTAEVWMEPGAPASQGKIYREKLEGRPARGKVALVLGAGNVASIGPMDALYKLFVEDEVVILKTNPVNAYLGPHIEEAMRPLVDEGVFVVVHGGAEIGEMLVNHPSVDTLHMTGSDRTHDAIIYGADPAEQARRKAAHEPLVTKPISSELGAVTPVLIVPGEWTEKDLDFQARNVASMVANNASFNCNAAKALVIADGWAQKDAFLAKLKERLGSLPARKAYYPGAKQRYQGFLEHYDHVEKLGPESDDVVPWTLLRDVHPEKGEYALSNEAFCGVLAIVELEAKSSREFLERAAPFANDVMWGTLSCVVLCDEETQRAESEAFDKVIRDLRYGGIAINAFGGLIYAMVVTTWGAFPGHPLEDIQSGRGVVHNAFMFDHPQKSVVRVPFRMAPTPLWFADHKTQASAAIALCEMEAAPSFLKLPKLIANALRG
jgi:acyl-CoA reductase-like NAD-dependent aldehyde dehydrogenase